MNLITELVMKALLVIDVQESLTVMKLYCRETFLASINSAVKHFTDNNDMELKGVDSIEI